MSSKRKQEYINWSLLDAARTGDITMLNQMLSKGADVDSATDDETPLSAVVFNGNPEFVDILLKAGADVNICSVWRKETPPMHAAFRGNDRCLELLLQAAADVNKQDTGGKTALMHAAEYVSAPLADTDGWNGNVRCVELLLQAEAAADVNTQDTDGKTALMHAAEYVSAPLADTDGWNGNVRCVKLLLQAGADVNRQNNAGKTATRHAADHVNLPPWVEALLQEVAGADKNKQDKDGWTALMYALNAANMKCVKILLNAGAGVNMGIYNFINLPFTTEERLQLQRLLLAAGQNITDVPQDCLNEIRSPEQMSLSHLCRDVIREHLLELDEHENLFVRVPRLGLPAALQKFLLFNTSLDLDEEEN